MVWSLRNLARHPAVPSASSRCGCAHANPHTRVPYHPPWVTRGTFLVVVYLANRREWATSSGKPRSRTILLWGSFAPAPIRWARARGGGICKFLSQVAFEVRSRRPQRTRAPPGFYAAMEPARRTERGLAHAPNSCPSSGFSRIAYATRDTSYCGTTARSGLAGSIEAISREKDR